MPVNSRNDPDRLLAVENYDQLNRDFYKAEPADYFSTRLKLILLAAAKPEAVEALLADGIEYGGLKMRPPVQQDIEDNGEESEALTSVVIAESEVLLHHTVECLLRLYAAHAGLPPCPRLEMARVRGPGMFKAMLKSRFAGESTSEQRNELASLFHLSPDRELLNPVPPKEMWEQSLDNLEGWLRYLAHEWLDRAPLYNVAKHGFGLNAGPGGLKFGDESEGPLVIQREGPAVTYLETRETEFGRRWFETMRFVDADLNFAITGQAIQMLRQLWSIARVLYSTRDVNDLKHFGFFDGTSVGDVLKAHFKDQSPFVPMGLNLGLSYYRETGDLGDVAPAT